VRYDLRICAGPDGLWGEIEVDLTDDLVFVSDPLYHRTPTCDGIEGESDPMPRAQAEEVGFLPCPDCWPE